MAFWIFKYNPKVYRLADQLLEANPTIDWRVPQHSDRIHPGDIAFLWQTGPRRGITAIMRVDQVPDQLAMFKREEAYFEDPDSQEALRIARQQPRVVGALIRKDVLLPMTALRNVLGLENLSAFEPKRETVFPVTPQEGNILFLLAHALSCPFLTWTCSHA